MFATFSIWMRMSDPIYSVYPSFDHDVLWPPGPPRTHKRLVWVWVWVWVLLSAEFVLLLLRMLRLIVSVSLLLFLLVIIVPFILIHGARVTFTCGANTVSASDSDSSVSMSGVIATSFRGVSVAVCPSEYPIVASFFVRCTVSKDLFSNAKLLANYWTNVKKRERKTEILAPCNFEPPCLSTPVWKRLIVLC